MGWHASIKSCIISLPCRPSLIGSVRLHLLIGDTGDILWTDEERARSRRRDLMIFLEVAIGALAAALLAVPVLLAVTGKPKPDTGERQSG